MYHVPVKKLLIGLGAGTLVLLLALIIAANWMISRVVSESFLAQQIEERLGVRAQIGKVEPKFAALAAVGIRDLAIAPRDPPDTDFARAPIRIGRARASIHLLALLKRRIEIAELLLEDAHLQVTLYRDGGNSLASLFDLPAAPAEQPPASPTRAQDLAFAIRSDHVRLRNIDVDLSTEGSDALVRLQDLGLQVTRIDVDPRDLSVSNHVELEVEGAVILDSIRNPDWRYVSVLFRGPVSARIFDVQTGAIDPRVTTRIHVDPASRLSPRVPAIESAFRRLAQLRKWGLDIGVEPVDLRFDPEQAIALHFYRGELTFQEAFSLLAGDWRLEVQENSQVRTGDHTHSISARIVASESLSATLREQLRGGLAVIPSELRPALQERFEENWFQNNRLVGVVRSKGDLADPTLTLENATPDLEEALRRAGKEQVQTVIRERIEQQAPEKAGELLRGLLQP